MNTDILSHEYCYEDMNTDILSHEYCYEGGLSERRESNTRAPGNGGVTIFWYRSLVMVLRKLPYISTDQLVRQPTRNKKPSYCFPLGISAISLRMYQCIQGKLRHH